jgi:hypothetical protein
MGEGEGGEEDGLGLHVHYGERLFDADPVALQVANTPGTHLKRANTAQERPRATCLEAVGPARMAD